MWLNFCGHDLTDETVKARKVKPFKNLINSWVMNNLISNPNCFTWILFPRFISKLHSSLNSPTKPISSSQFHSNFPPSELIPIFIQSIHNFTCHNWIQKSVPTKQEYTQHTKITNTIKLTCELAVHELYSLLLMPKPFPIIIFTSGKVLQEQLRVEIGIDRFGRRRRISCAPEQKGFPAPESSDPGEGFGWKKLYAMGKTRALQRDRH